MITERGVNGSLNGTAPVAMFTSTGTSVVRTIRIYNADSVAITVTVSVATVTVFKLTLQPGYTLLCDDVVVLNSTVAISAVLTSAMTTTNPTYMITYAQVS